ncbi:MAG TPA: hypothetical protein VGC63_03920 [Solirubrobacterales bacterium]
MGALEIFELTPSQGIHHRDQQLARPKRLDQVAVDAVAAEPEGPCCHLGVVFSGDEDYGNLGVFFGDFFGQGQPRAVQHLKVTEGEVKAIRRKLLVGLRNAARKFAPVSVCQRPIDQSQHLGLIVSDQDARQPGLRLYGLGGWT